MFKKLISLMMSLVVTFGILGASNLNVYANSIDKQPVIEETVTVKEVSKCKSAPKVIGKKALKWAIKNTTQITNVIGKHFGKSSAIKAGKYMNGYIKPVLRELERLDDVTYGQLNKAIRNSLKGEIGDTSAKVIANGVELAIELVCPF